MNKRIRKNIKIADRKSLTNRFRIAIDMALLLSRLVQVVEYIKDYF